MSHSHGTKSLRSSQKQVSGDRMVEYLKFLDAFRLSKGKCHAVLLAISGLRTTLLLFHRERIQLSIIFRRPSLLAMTPRITISRNLVNQCEMYPFRQAKISPWEHIQGQPLSLYRRLLLGLGWV